MDYLQITLFLSGKNISMYIQYFHCWVLNKYFSGICKENSSIGKTKIYISLKVKFMKQQIRYEDENIVTLEDICGYSA